MPCPCLVFETARRASTITGAGDLASPLVIRRGASAWATSPTTSV
jgi:hypothetical protein